MADALSRIPKTPSGTLLLLTVPCLTFLEKLKSNLTQDPYFVQFWQAIIDKPDEHPEFSITQDLILKGG